MSEVVKILSTIHILKYFPNNLKNRRIKKGILIIIKYNVKIFQKQIKVLTTN